MRNTFAISNFSLPTAALIFHLITLVGLPRAAAQGEGGSPCYDSKLQAQKDVDEERVLSISEKHTQGMDLELVLTERANRETLDALRRVREIVDKKEILHL